MLDFHSHRKTPDPFEIAEVRSNGVRAWRLRHSASGRSLGEFQSEHSARRARAMAAILWVPAFEEDDVALISAVLWRAWRACGFRPTGETIDENQILGLRQRRRPFLSAGAET